MLIYQYEIERAIRNGDMDLYKKLQRKQDLFIDIFFGSLMIGAILITCLGFFI